MRTFSCCSGPQLRSFALERSLLAVGLRSVIPGPELPGVPVRVASPLPPPPQLSLWCWVTRLPWPTRSAPCGPRALPTPELRALPAVRTLPRSSRPRTGGAVRSTSQGVGSLPPVLFLSPRGSPGSGGR